MNRQARPSRKQLSSTLEEYKEIPIKGIINYVKANTNTYTNSKNELIKYMDESRILRSFYYSMKY